MLAVGPIASAEASQQPLLKVGPNGQITAGQDLLPMDMDFGTGADRPVRNTPQGVRATAATATSAVASTILNMQKVGQITALQASDAITSWTAAIRTRRKLHGNAGLELGNIISIVVGIHNRKALTPSRLPELMLIVKRNTEFFSKGKMPAYHQRVQFSGSDIVWQYYPGQGLQLQVLATFGVANGLWRANLPGHLKALMDEMLSLRVKRAGGTAWEYMFNFDGGSPPWTSAMSQATGIQALSRAAVKFSDPNYLAAANSSLAIFRKAPPSGVRVATPLGPWYLMYSFDPSLKILNGFLQTLVGLNEMANKVSSGDARELFDAAEPVARAAVPHFMSSGWSYYSPGVWSSESYHQLTQGFLAELCLRTTRPTYCTAATKFTTFLDQPPRLAVKTRSLKRGSAARVKFWVSKPSTVAIRVLASGKTIRTATISCDPGNHSLGNIRVPRGAKTITVRARGTDASGRTRTVVAALSGTIR